MTTFIPYILELPYYNANSVNILELSYVSISWQECKPASVVKLFSVGSKTLTHKKKLWGTPKNFKMLEEKQNGGYTTS